jgi:CheY-like chemotaxis protein
MIVEDNSLMRLTLAVALVEDNVEIVSASNGIDALKLFQDHDGKFDAILTDNAMPKMDGLEFVRSIRGTGFAGRIVVMSGDMTPEKLKEFKEHSITAFFPKPFEIGQVRAAMNLTHGTKLTNDG